MDLSLQRGTARLLSWSTAILGIYDFDLPAVVTSCTINLHADDTTIYYISRDTDSVTSAINDDLQLIATWIESNKLTMNIRKTQVMRAARLRAEQINIQINGTTILKQAGLYQVPGSNL